jgi:hypothetical protein
VPLFVEELTRAVLESSNAKLTEREIPVTLHDSLMARLDRLGPAKEVAQVGAVIGSEFSDELLHAVHPIAEEGLQRALRNLADAELLYVRGIAPEATYQFKHALVRDAAYEALLKSRRKDLHRLVARTINDEFPAIAESQPEILARHWTDAGETDLAIAEWSRAGQAAQTRSAFSEALESYHQTLALLNLLPESAERDRRELELRQPLIVVLAVTRGDAAPERLEATERAATLAEKGDSLAHLASLVCIGSYNAYVSGDLRSAAIFADDALELGRREGSPGLLGSGYHLQVLTRWSRGDLAGVEKHFTAGVALFKHPDFRRIPGGVAVSAFGVASLNALLLGRLEVARERMAHAIATANENNPYDVAWSGYFAAALQLRLREYLQAEALAERAVELSEKNQFPHVAAYSRCVLGQARAQLGRATEGIALIRRGIAGLLEVGNHHTSYHAASLAAAQEREGALVEALETVQQALQVNPDELSARPEILRVRGEVRLKLGQSEHAEADFCEAIGLAQKIGAKMWTLRATMSLARLLAKLGRRDEARAMLAEIYGWFTEGFDTADLKEAKALLEKLGE